MAHHEADICVSVPTTEWQRLLPSHELLFGGQIGQPPTFPRGPVGRLSVRPIVDVYLVVGPGAPTAAAPLNAHRLRISGVMSQNDSPRFNQCRHIERKILRFNYKY